jgi:hypothetical protein
MSPPPEITDAWMDLLLHGEFPGRGHAVRIEAELPLPAAGLGPRRRVRCTTNAARLGLIPPRSLLLLGVESRWPYRAAHVRLALFSSGVPASVHAEPDWGWLGRLVALHARPVTVEPEEIANARRARP